MNASRNTCNVSISGSTGSLGCYFKRKPLKILKWTASKQSIEYQFGPDPDPDYIYLQFLWGKAVFNRPDQTNQKLMQH